MGRNRLLGSPYEQQFVSSDFTTAHNIDRYLVETAGIVVTLDPNAFEGDQVAIVDASNDAGAAPITFVPSPGQSIFGPPTINTNGGSALLTFVNIPGAGSGWTIQQGAPVTTSQFLTGTTTAGPTPTVFTFEIPLCPPGGDPATFVGVVILQATITTEDDVGDWAGSTLVFSCRNNAGTVDHGLSSPTFDFNTSLSLSGPGAITLSASFGVGILNVHVTTMTLPGAPVFQWKVGYSITTS